jgi:hypothetical protein
MGVIVGVGGTDVAVSVDGADVSIDGADIVVIADGVITEVGFGPQPFKARVKMIAARKVALLFFMAKPSFGIVQLNALKENSEVVSLGILCALIHRQRLGQVPREIGIESPHHAHVIRKHLQWQDAQQGADTRI